MSTFTSCRSAATSSYPAAWDRGRSPPTLHSIIFPTYPSPSGHGAALAHVPHLTEIGQSYAQAASGFRPCLFKIIQDHARFVDIHTACNNRFFYDPCQHILHQTVSAGSPIPQSGIAVCTEILCGSLFSPTFLCLYGHVGAPVHRPPAPTESQPHPHARSR